MMNQPWARERKKKLNATTNPDLAYGVMRDDIRVKKRFEISRYLI